MYSMAFVTGCSFPTNVLFKKQVFGNFLRRKTMQKSLIFILLVGVVSVCADTRKFQGQSKAIQRVVSPIKHDDNAIDWCPDCIQTEDNLINILLNIILQGGVLNTCGDLCNLVTNETKSALLGFICDAGCIFLGLKEFVKLIQEADLDPIYYCERINLCPSRFNDLRRNQT